MNQMNYTFTSVEDMVSFVNRAESCTSDVDVRYNHMVIDGKSLMGVMNVGVGRSVEIVCHDPEIRPEMLAG